MQLIHEFYKKNKGFLQQKLIYLFISL